jgi:hypothetical protein
MFTQFLSRTKGVALLAANNFYSYVFPKPASEYAETAVSEGTSAFNDAILKNMSPAIRLTGTILKGAWPAATVFYTKFSKPTIKPESEGEKEAAYLNNAYQQMTEARLQALDAGYELAANAKNASYHATLAAINAVSVGVIGAVEAGKYVAPRVASVSGMAAEKAAKFYNSVSSSFLPSFTEQLKGLEGTKLATISQYIGFQASP